MSAETPNPQPGDRVRVTFDADFLADDMGDRMVDVADGMGPIHIALPSWATVEVLKPALCAEIEGATGIRCQQPTGHLDGHKGTSTEAQTAAVGYPLFVSWPATETPARQAVRVENGPGLSVPDRQRVADLLVSGDVVRAVRAAAAAGLTGEQAERYVRDMPEWQTYLNHHGRTEVDEGEADRMRAMGFDRQPEFKVTDEQRAEIGAALAQRRSEFHWSHGGQHTLDEPALSGVVADIVWAAIKRDRERGGR